MESASHTEPIAADASACFEAVMDFASYPQWQSVVRAVEVRTRDEAGRGREVAFEIDLKIRRIRYTLIYSYVEPTDVTWTYAGGDVRDITGSFTFRPSTQPGLVNACYALNIDFGMPVPGLIRTRLEREVMRRAVLDLKARVESLA